jgi:uncharacterized protein YqhQ
LQLLPVLESGEETTLVGGQAVIEGVMMRAPHSYCLVVRKPNGELATEERAIPRMSEKYPIFRYPVFRGLGTLGQAMKLGAQAMQFSLSQTLAEDEKQPELPSWMLTVQMIFALVFFVVVYKFIPLFLASRMATGRFAINMLDGGIRMGILLGFLFLISSAKDFRRMFEYHGAEHKVVFNFESGQPVTIENAQKFETFHPRCGTSFLVVLMVIAMIVYALLPIDGFWLKLGARVALLPLIVGLSYELIRFAARRQGTLMGMLSLPGLWLQRITTKPPDDAQAAIAIEALNGAMALEEKQGGELIIA